MKNEDFLDMLGNIDDSIIDECASVSPITKKHRHIKAVLSLAAVFTLTVCAMLILKFSPEGFITGFLGEEHTVSETYEQESTLLPDETTSVIQDVTTTVTDIETTISVIPEITTSAEITSLPEETTNSEIPTDSNAPYFVDVPYADLIFAGTDGTPDDSSDSKRVTLQELFRIYGMVIIPSVIGEYLPDFLKELKDRFLTGSNGINSVEDNTFSFTLPDDSNLVIRVSKTPLQLRPAEEENMNFTSEIEGESVLLLKGYEAENGTIFSAFFQKNGLYFRIIQQGEALSEEKFVDIIKRLL